MTSIAVRSGALYDYQSPHPDSIVLYDIIHSLARQVRYNGQIDEFYTVLQHSMVVGWMLGNDMAILGLMHDACEAFISDLPSPLKGLIDSNGMVDDYKLYENLCQQAIYDKFDIRYPSHEEEKRLRAADSAAGFAEAELFFTEKALWLDERMEKFDNPGLISLAMFYTQAAADKLNPIGSITGFYNLEDAFLKEYNTAWHARRSYG